MVWGNQSGGVPDDQPTGRLDGTLVVRPFRILMVCTGNICRSPMAERVLVAALSESLTREFGADAAVSLARQVDVRSAGTVASEGSPMTHEAQHETERFGGDGSAHLAHRLELADVQGADLVLAMSREHRRAVVALDPRASNRVFTLTEFVRLIEAPGILTPSSDAASAVSSDATSVRSSDVTSASSSALSPATTGDRLLDQSIDDAFGDAFAIPFDAEDDVDFPAALRSMVSTISVSRGYLPPPASDSEFDIADPYRQSARVYARVGAVIGRATTALADAVVGVIQDP